VELINSFDILSLIHRALRPYPERHLQFRSWARSRDPGLGIVGTWRQTTLQKQSLLKTEGIDGIDPAFLDMVLWDIGEDVT
jgi:hypothetical protein